MGFCQVNRQNNRKKQKNKKTENIKTRRACVRGASAKTSRTVHPKAILGKTLASYEFLFSLTDIHHS